MPNEDRPALSNVGFDVRDPLPWSPDNPGDARFGARPGPIVGAIVGTILGAWALVVLANAVVHPYTSRLGGPVATPILIRMEEYVLTVFFGFPSIAASGAILARGRTLVAAPLAFACVFALPPYALLALYAAHRVGFAMLAFGAWIMLGWVPALALRHLLERDRFREIHPGTAPEARASE